MNTSILIVEDHELFRSGLRAVLEQESDFEVVGEAGDGALAMQELRRGGVDIMLLDLNLPGGLRGAEIAALALESFPKLGIVVVTMHEDSYYLRESLAAGARGYVLKRSAPQTLHAAIRRVRAGDTFIDPALSGALVAGFLGRAAPRARMAPAALTAREREITRLVALGHTNPEIGADLGISVRTVEAHRARIMARMGFGSRAELVRYALETGIVSFGANEPTSSS